MLDMPFLPRSVRFSRRTLLRAGAVAVPASFALAAQEHSLKTIGLQLYTVRDILPKHPLEVLKEIDAIGYREVETTFSDHPVWSELHRTRLKPVSEHLAMPLFDEKNAVQMTAAIADAKANGVRFLVYPYVPPPERAGLEGMRKLAATLNVAGQKCKDAGLRLCYHNHAFEFQPIDGTTPFDVLLQETKPDLVGLEMDVFWVSVAGHDPVKLLQRHADRVQLLHLKDKAPETKVQYGEDVAAGAFKEVGHGSLDFAAILRAAAATRVEHYFVEQDQTPGDPLASVRQSYEYLSKLKF